MKDKRTCGWNAPGARGIICLGDVSPGLWWTIGPGYISFHPTFDTHVTTQDVDTWAFQDSRVSLRLRRQYIFQDDMRSTWQVSAYVSDQVSQ